MPDERDRVDQYGLRERDIRDFMENPVWRCMVEDLKERLEETQVLMGMAPMEDMWGEDKSGQAVLARAGIKRLQGDSTAVQHLLALPQAMIEHLKAGDAMKTKEEEE